MTIEELNKAFNRLFKKEKKMTETTFYVDRSDRNKWDSEFMSDLDTATNTARRLTWENGQSYTIFQAIATTEVPEELNTIKVTKLS